MRYALPPATFFVAVQFYTSLQALSPTPQVGYAFVNRPAAALLAAILVVAALGCAALLRGANGPFPSGPSRALLAAWIGATLLSALLGLAPLEGLQVVGMMLCGAAFHLALVRFYARPKVGRTVVFAYLAAGTLATVAGVLLWVARTPAGLYAATHGRAAGFFVSSNEFAAFLDLFVFVAFGAGSAASDRRLRALGLGAALLGAVALLLTFSRESWLGSALGAAFLAFALRQRKLGLGLLTVTAACALLLALRPFPHHDPSDTFSRLRTLEGGLRVAALFPLTGVGPVEYWRVYPVIRPVNGPPPGTFGALHPHDLYVSLAAETGLVGVGAAILGWVWFARSIRRRLARAPRANRRFALGICAGLVSALVAGLFDTIGVVQMTFVWIPFTALALVAAENGLPWERQR